MPISARGRQYITDDMSIAGTYLFKCSKCSWWFLEEYGEWVETHSPWHSYALLAIGVLKKWAVASKTIPISALRTYIGSHARSAALKVLHPTAFERLVADCLKWEYRPCEVKHVGVAGGAGDGGIDLYLIREDEEWLVQVKRRLNDDPEPIETIRSLNGVLLREGKHKGIVVTSASRFTRNANEEARIATPGPYEVQLISGGEIIEMVATQNVQPCFDIFESEDTFKELDPIPEALAQLLFPQDGKVFSRGHSHPIEEGKPIPHFNFERWSAEEKQAELNRQYLVETEKWVIDLITLSVGPTNMAQSASSLLREMLDVASNNGSVLAFRDRALELKAQPKLNEDNVRE